MKFYPTFHSEVQRKIQETRFSGVSELGIKLDLVFTLLNPTLSIHWFAKFIERKHKKIFVSHTQPNPSVFFHLTFSVGMKF